jgi:Rab9 effector protein with kelch motifs
MEKWFRKLEKQKSSKETRSCVALVSGKIKTKQILSVICDAYMYLLYTPMASSENGHVKRRKTGEARPSEPESEQEEHSLSLSQHSSPSQSDQEQNGAHKLSASPNTSVSALQPFVRLNANGTLRAPGGANGTLRAPGPGGVSSRSLKTDQFLRTMAPQHQQEVQFLSSDHKPQPRPPGPPPVCHSYHITF